MGSDGRQKAAMSVKILGLRTTIYQVADLARAKVWYAGAFGVEPYFDEPYYVGFNVGGYELGLQPLEQEALSTAQETSDGEVRTRSVIVAGVVAYWGVDDVQEVYVNLLEHGARVHGAPQDVGGGIVTATVLDLDDNVIGLIYNPHFSQ